MQRHWCTSDRNWFDFEGECSWCGMNEAQAKAYHEGTSDQMFREMMNRLRSSARPDITDD